MKDGVNIVDLYARFNAYVDSKSRTRAKQMSANARSEISFKVR